MAQNYLREIKPKTFEGLGSLTVLDIKQNKIEVFSSGSFSDLKSLEKT